MKRIECLTDFRSKGQNYYKGELRVVSEGDAGHFCGTGWARDISGEILTGSPDLSPKIVRPDETIAGQETEGVK